MYGNLRKKLTTFLVIGLIAGMAILTWKDISFVFDSNHGRLEELSPNPEEQMKGRLTHLHQTCTKYRSLMNITFYKKNRTAYLVAPSYNWTACKAGKTGSTFWSRVFYILTRNGRDVYKVRDFTREDLHTQSVAVSFKDPRSYPTRLIQTVRNPYTRLFSAYIDRVFTASTTPLVLIKNKGKCKSEITFREFLQNVIDGFNEGTMDHHWIPLFYYCKPCEIDPTFIVKIETLKTDFPFIMNQTKLEPYKAETLNKAIAENTEFSINTLVTDVLDLIAPNGKHHAKDCQSMKQITERLWEALKIQGYIAENVQFPDNRYKNETDYENSNIFRDILVETSKMYPMTKSDVKNQRQRFLNKFYEKIDRSTLESIQTMYSADFELFGYSKDPPTW